MESDHAENMAYHFYQNNCRPDKLSAFSQNGVDSREM